MADNKLCPKCGSLLIEDANEELIFDESGNMTLDAFLALVCTKKCGFYERI
ncbi:hypothetical protein [Bacillus sp. FJAT-29937]|uniref:hypothetical protein n=1 Tax=Bacillus sp. FJAT-29937 TaxID=1720553 RepID=UPI000AF911AE|nr:hypothetical protein [Bacillus sp. FJAT-29937]